ncbi:hypothetical protein NXF25_004287, partial [Crotalus adamanteus]
PPSLRVEHGADFALPSVSQLLDRCCFSGWIGSTTFPICSSWEQNKTCLRRDGWVRRMCNLVVSTERRAGPTIHVDFQLLQRPRDPKSVLWLQIRQHSLFNHHQHPTRGRSNILLWRKLRFCIRFSHAVKRGSEVEAVLNFEKKRDVYKILDVLNSPLTICNFGISAGKVHFSKMPRVQFYAYLPRSKVLLAQTDSSSSKHGMACWKCH